MLRRLLSKRWKVELESLFSLLHRSFLDQDTDCVVEVVSELYLSNYPGGIWNRFEIAAVENFGLAHPKLAETVRNARLAWEKKYRMDVHSPSARRQVVRLAARMCTLETSRLIPCASMVALGLCNQEESNFVPMALEYKEVPSYVRKKMESVFVTDYPKAFVRLLKAFVRALYVPDPPSKPHLETLLYYTEQICLGEVQKKKDLPSSMDFPKINTDLRYTELLWDTMLVVCVESQKQNIEALRTLYRYYRNKEGSCSERLFLYQAILCIAYNTGFDDPLDFSSEMITDEKADRLFLDTFVASHLPTHMQNKHGFFDANSNTASLQRFLTEDTVEVHETNRVKNLFSGDAKRILVDAEKKYGTDCANSFTLRKNLRHPHSRKNKRKENDNCMEETNDAVVDHKRTKERHHILPQTLGRYQVVLSHTCESVDAHRCTEWFALIRKDGQEESVLIQGPISNKLQARVQRLMDELKTLVGLASGHTEVVKDNGYYFILRMDGMLPLPYHEESPVNRASSGMPTLAAWKQSHAFTDKHMFQFLMVALFRWTFGMRYTFSENLLFSKEEDRLLSMGERDVFCRDAKSGAHVYNEQFLLEILFPGTRPSLEFCQRMLRYVKTRYTVARELLSRWKNVFLEEPVRSKIRTYNLDDGRNQDNVFTCIERNITIASKALMESCTL